MPRPIVNPLTWRLFRVLGEGIEVAVATEGEDELLLVPLQPLCVSLGISWPTARREILDHAIFAESHYWVRRSSAGGDPERLLLCLPMRYFLGWLFHLEAETLAPAAQQQLIVYRRSCLAILNRAMVQGRFTAGKLRADPATGETRLNSWDRLLETLENLARHSQ